MKTNLCVDNDGMQGLFEANYKFMLQNNTHKLLYVQIQRSKLCPNNNAFK